MEEQLDEWEDFLDGFSVDYNVNEKLESDGNGIYFVLYPRVDFRVEWKDNASVPSLEETVEYAERYKVNFSACLENLE